MVETEDQLFESGLTVRINAEVYDDSKADLRIFLENITPNLHARSLFNTSQVTTHVNVPNGFFVVLPGLAIEEREEEDILQVPCLGGIALCGGGSKHRGIREQQNFILIARPVILKVGEKPQLENLFD